MWIVRWVLLVLAIVAVLGFALQNQQGEVEIQFLKWSTGEIPLYLALFAAFAFGMVTFLLISVFSHLQVLSELGKVKKQKKKLDAELEEVHAELAEVKSRLHARPLQASTEEGAGSEISTTFKERM
ncbi:LapA family protein [bacterium]|nr:LapA family protein [bacterium]